MITGLLYRVLLREYIALLASIDACRKANNLPHWRELETRVHLKKALEACAPPGTNVLKEVEEARWAETEWEKDSRLFWERQVFRERGDFPF